MGWLRDFVSNPVKAVSGTVSNVFHHPLAAVNPTTWIGTAVASGGRTQVADTFVGAQTAGGLLLGAGVASGAIGGAAGVGGAGTAGGAAGLGGAIKFAQTELDRLTSAATHDASSAAGAGVGDVTGGSNGDAFNVDNAAPGIALAMLGLALIIAAS